MLRPNCTLFDPRRDHCLRFFRKLTGRRHFEIFIANCGHDQTIRDRARRDRWTRIATFQQCVERIEPQTALLLFVAVTFDATLHQERTNFVFKEQLARTMLCGRFTI